MPGLVGSVPNPTDPGWDRLFGRPARFHAASHEIREINSGDADWRAEGVRADGRKFAVIYDNPVRGLMSDKFAYYDREADIAWLPTGDSADVVSEEVDWGLIDHDSTTDEVVAIEV